MSRMFSRLVLGVVFAATLTGCRLYGDYGAEQASYDQITKINAQFSQDYERAGAELAILENAAQTNNELQQAVAQYKALREAHQEMSSRHQETAGSLEVKAGMLGKLSTSYRDINRALGYIAAEQAGMRNQYLSFASQLLEASQRAAVSSEQSRYQVAPPYYERIRFALTPHSVSEALEARAGS